MRPLSVSSFNLQQCLNNVKRQRGLTVSLSLRHDDEIPDTVRPPHLWHHEGRATASIKRVLTSWAVTAAVSDKGGGRMTLLLTLVWLCDWQVSAAVRS